MLRTLFVCLGIISAGLLNGCVLPPLEEDGSEQSSVTLNEIASLLKGDEIADSLIKGDDEIIAYVLKPLDPIYIRFSGIREQQALELVIDENGEISLLHLREPIKAAGLTTSALEDRIETLYVEGGIYKNVSVNVTMTAKVYYMQGEVKQPGQFQLMSGTTLLQAIAGSRGYTPFANKKKVTITRQNKIYTYNLKEVEQDPTLDVKIEAGDVIKVWQQWY